MVFDRAWCHLGFGQDGGVTIAAILGGGVAIGILYRSGV